MLTIQRILAPTDFSDLATRAVRYASDLARTFQSELHVLHVVVPSEHVALAPSPTPEMVVAAPAPPESLAELTARKRQCLEGHVSQVTGELLSAPVIAVGNGVAWEEIARYAHDAKIQLIVIGTHARGIVQRIFLGSTSRAVLEHVACPVLMVPIAAMEGRG